MRGLIKSSQAGGVGHVRPLTLAASAPVPDASERQRLALEEALRIAEDRIVALEAETVRLQQVAGAAEAKGHAAGLEKGFREGTARATESLALLSKGIDAANARFSAELDAIEFLAAAVAREALGRIIGDTETHADLLIRTLRQELDRLEARSVIRIEVSSFDFPDEAALVDLTRTLSSPHRQLCVAQDMPAGGCRIHLVLGQVDLSLERQWERIGGALNDLARSEDVL